MVGEVGAAGRRRRQQRGRAPQGETQTKAPKHAASDATQKDQDDHEYIYGFDFELRAAWRRRADSPNPRREFNKNLFESNDGLDDDIMMVQWADESQPREIPGLVVADWKELNAAAKTKGRPTDSEFYM